MANRPIEFTSDNAGPFYAFPASEADFTDWLTLREECDDADDRWTVTLDDSDDWYIFQGSSAPTSWHASEAFIDFELQRTLGAITSGSGARTVTVTVTVESVAVQGARVRVTKGGESYLQLTNISGQITFNLDDGTWVVSITSPGATFAGASLVVDGTESVTYDMDSLASTPSDPDYITAFYLCLDANGDPEEGVPITMVAHSCLPCDDSPSGFALDSSPRIANSDSDGMAEFPNTVAGFRYQITRGTGRTFMVEVPADATTPYPLRSIIGAEV